jgi:glyoxylate reductase
MRPRVFITRRLPEIAAETLAAAFDVDCENENRPLPPARLAEVLNDYDAVLTTITEKVTAEMLTDACRVRVISNYAVGLDNIDVDAATRRGIRVCNTPDAVTQSTADHTFALLLSLIRRTAESHRFVQEGQWGKWDPFIFVGEELYGKCLGIVGFGRVGQAVAMRAVGFGLTVIYYDVVDAVAADPLLRQRVQAVSLAEVFSRSDYITLHASLNQHSRGMIDARAFGQMTRQPVLVNMARGAIVHTPDLLVALDTGQIRGAALDVTDPEPIDARHPLTTMRNCIISPHIGTATHECRHNMAKTAAANIVNHFAAAQAR